MCVVEGLCDLNGVFCVSCYGEEFVDAVLCNFNCWFDGVVVRMVTNAHV